MKKHAKHTPRQILLNKYFSNALMLATILSQCTRAPHKKFRAQRALARLN